MNGVKKTQWPKIWRSCAIREAALQSLDNTISSSNSEQILEAGATDLDNAIFFQTIDDFNDIKIDAEHGGCEGFNLESSSQSENNEILNEARVYTAARNIRNGTKEGNTFSYLIATGKSITIRATRT